MPWEAFAKWGVVAGLLAVAFGFVAGRLRRGREARGELEQAEENLDAIARGNKASREWDGLSRDEQWDRLSDAERD